MDNELYTIARKLAGDKASLERVAKILSTDKGRRVISELLSGGGLNIKDAADAVKRGDVSGIGNVISKIASTQDGAELLDELKSEL